MLGRPIPLHFCIIGAGVSGLRTAGLLATAGFKVTLLEARDRLGGRVHQSSRLGFPIDLGASWIHGTEGNPLVSLADRTKSATVACGTVDSICDSNGVWLDPSVARLYYEEVWEILELAMQKSRTESDSLSDVAKMMDFFRGEVRRRRPQAEAPEAYEAMMVKIVEMWGAFMGNECEHQSLKNLWLDAGLKGDNLFLASTFKDILNSLSLQVTNNATVRLGCEVTSIKNASHGFIEIEAADGFRGSFKNVIVTAPLGWLKRNEHVFSPALSPEISTAIHSLGYGNLDKIFIKFPRAFWDVPISGHPGDKTSRASFPVESLFLRPEYAADTNPAQWRQEIISLSSLPAPFSQPVIMFFLYGQWGRHITGLVRNLQHDQEYCRILTENFRPYFSRLPNYDFASADCKPSAFLTTDWQNDKFAGYGSFTNQPTGSGDCERHFEVLREGMGEGRGIWFAGEHTSPPGGLGTVAGAYWSGEEVVRRISRCYSMVIDT